MMPTLDTTADEDSSPPASLRSIRSSLHSEHQYWLVRAIRNVLATSVAETTFAQIVDGLPISDVERDKYGCHSVSFAHPLHKRHKKLCPGALDKLRELNDTFKLESLEFPAEVRPRFSYIILQNQLYNP
jgi:hypothetical protein